jgi:hypothetical protein
MMVSWSNMYKIIIAVFIFLIFIDIVIKPKKALRWSFKGPVEKVWYDRKGIPFITIKGKEYDVFYFDWDFETKIEKGDTVIKQKGDLRLKLIRPNTRDTIYYNSNE